MEGRTVANREGMGLIDALLPYMEKGLNKIIDARLLQERFFLKANCGWKFQLYK